MDFFGFGGEAVRCFFPDVDIDCGCSMRCVICETHNNYQEAISYLTSSADDKADNSSAHRILSSFDCFCFSSQT